jgi:hypothetical protein
MFIDLGDPFVTAGRRSSGIEKTVSGFVQKRARRLGFAYLVDGGEHLVHRDLGKGKGADEPGIALLDPFRDLPTLIEHLLLSIPRKRLEGPAEEFPLDGCDIEETSATVGTSRTAPDGIARTTEGLSENPI